MKKARLCVMILLAAAILMDCIPSRASGISVYLLANEVPATELPTADLDGLELQEELLLSSDDIMAFSRARHEMALTAEAYERIQHLFPPLD